MPAHILGTSAFYHDSAACLLRDGEIVAAALWEVIEPTVVYQLRTTPLVEPTDPPVEPAEFPFGTEGGEC